LDVLLLYLSMEMEMDNEPDIGEIGKNEKEYFKTDSLF